MDLLAVSITIQWVFENLAANMASGRLLWKMLQLEVSGCSGFVDRLVTTGHAYVQVSNFGYSDWPLL